MNILIIKTGALGDVLRTTVILEGLIEKYTNPKIYWLTSNESLPLIDNNPYIEQIYTRETINEEFLSRIYDLVISLEEDSITLGIIDKIKKRKIFGLYIENNQIKYSHDGSHWFDMSLSSRFGRQIADELKKANMFSYPELLYRMLELKWNKQRYRLFLIKKDLKYTNELKKKINLDIPIIGFVTGSGGRWPMKTLNVDRQIELIEMIHDNFPQIQILCLTGQSSLELENTTKIIEKCPYTLTHEIQDIAEFIGIVNICNIIITPDTLSMHIGIGLGKYIIAYFTVTSESEIEIYTGKKIIAKHKDFCTYTKENKERPNIADAIDLKEIIHAIENRI